MLEVKETSPSHELRYGHAAVGPTAVPLTPNSIKCVRGVLVRAPGPNDLVPNTDVCFIGLKSVTCTGAVGSATDGLPLLPGGAVELPIDDPSMVYVISNTANQDVAWMGL
jgi:hypothetical protein